MASIVSYMSGCVYAGSSPSLFEAAVADEVDDDVVAEALSERHRQADGGDRPLRVVGVHVDDRSVEALGEVARVTRRAPVLRIGREADLVVRDQVERLPWCSRGAPAG